MEGLVPILILNFWIWHGPLLETSFNSACPAHYALLSGPLLFIYFSIKIDSPFSPHKIQRSPFRFQAVHVIVAFFIQQNSETCLTGHQIGYGLETYWLKQLFLFLFFWASILTIILTRSTLNFTANFFFFLRRNSSNFHWKN